MHRTARFSTDDLPFRERTDAWRELYGRSVLDVALETVGDAPFDCTFTASALGPVAFVRGTTTGAIFTKTRELAGGDDLLLIVHGGAHGAVEQCRREALLRPGDAALLHGGEVGRSVHPDGVAFLNLRLPGAALADRVPHLLDRLARAIPAADPALALLQRYVALLEQAPPASPAVAAAAADHVCDLAALALGGPAAEPAPRAAGAARLALVMADLRRLAWQPRLTIGVLAARHGISPVYLRKLFAGRGTSFAQALLAARLDLACDRLRDPRWHGHTIGAIALESGFGDISYFNRSFRARYGVTPSDFRDAALLDG
ncbi:AraC family transcriptional regulator [Sphingomonas sp. MMS12-HWE2-04]|uniref:helix-turn-helix transcriptional regulator n=1 Tax=Sphingomonas sp. MMS12-HWE2-04 TaxID=3234199 RepID=UPI00384BAE1B